MEKKKLTKEEMLEAAKKAAAAKKSADTKSAATKSAPKKTAPKKTATRAKEDDYEEAVDEPKKKLEKPVSSEEKSKVRGLRTGAIILWVLAVAAEVGAFFAFSYAMRNNAFANGFDLSRPEILLLVGALVVDAVFCIIAGQLWKKSNRISPCLANSKLVRTLWHQLGVIMVLVCLLPIGIYLVLKTDKLDKKTRMIILAICTALFVGAGVSSADFKQPSDEEIQQLQQEAIEANADSDVFWTRFGKSYHFDDTCSAYTRSKEENRMGGTLEEAFEANRWDPCDFCAGGKDVEVIDEAA